MLLLLLLLLRRPPEVRVGGHRVGEATIRRSKPGLVPCRLAVKKMRVLLSRQQKDAGGMPTYTIVEWPGVRLRQRMESMEPRLQTNRCGSSSSSSSSTGSGTNSCCCAGQ